MELSPQQQAMAQASQQQIAQQMQIDFTVMQVKINLLGLAKDMAATEGGSGIYDIYLHLREEVLGIPNPNNEKKENVKKDK